MSAPAWNAAAEGQTASLMYCACNHLGVYVRTAMADRWKCPVCKKGWASGQKIRLGRDGAMPISKNEAA